MTGGDLSRLASYGWAESLSFALVPSVLGLAAAEISLRLAAKALRGSFLDRYAALAATVWIGGCCAAWRSPPEASSATRRLA
jgi:hypothetical protein